eukprot:gene18383-24853_t
MFMATPRVHFNSRMPPNIIGKFMKIYDMNKYDLCGKIQELDYAPLAMDCWTAPRTRDSDLVVFGDGGGFVRLYQLRLNPLWKHQHHTDWITDIQYVDDMNFIVASSLDKFISISDAEERVPLKYVDDINFIVASSLDKFIYISDAEERVPLKYVDDMNFIVASSLNKFISISDAEERVPLKYVDDINFIVASSLDKFISISDAEERVPLKIQCVDDMNFIVASSLDKYISCMIDAEERVLLKIQYVDDTNFIVASSLDKFISISDAEDHVPFKVLEGHTKGVNCVDWSSIYKPVLEGHTKGVNCVDWSSIYKLVCSGGQDRRIILWNPFSQKPLATLLGHAGSVMKVVVNDRDNHIISLGADKVVKMWDIRNHRCIQTVLEGHTKGVNCVDWSSIYKLVCSGGQDRRIILWNPFSQKPLATLLGHAGSVMKVVVNDRDNHIISLGADKVVKMWDIRNHRCIQTEECTLYAMRIDNRRKQVTTGNRGLKTWKQTVTTSSSAGHRDPVMRVLYNPLFHEAVSGDSGGTVSIWSIPTGKLRFRFYNAHGEFRITAMNFDSLGFRIYNTDGEFRITAMTFDSSWRRLITGGEHGEAKVWNFSSGACLTTLKPPACNGDEVTAVLGVHAALTRHFLVAGWDRKITFYEDECEKEITFYEDECEKEVPPGRSMSGNKADILDMVCMEGSPIVATWSAQRRMWDQGRDDLPPNERSAKRRMWYQERDELPPNERAVECIRFLHGAEMKSILVSVGADRFIRLWDTLSGTCLLENFTGHKLGETVAALAVDTSNSVIATGDSAGFIKVWDMSSVEVPSHGMSSRRSSSSHMPSFHRPRSAQVTEATGTITEVALWKAHTQNITALDWADSGNGLFLISCSLDRAIHLWSEFGALVGTFGTSLWSWLDRTTWRTQEREELKGQDAFDMGDEGPSRKHPHATRAESGAVMSRLARQYSCFRKSSAAGASGMDDAASRAIEATSGSTSRPSSAAAQSRPNSAAPRASSRPNSARNLNGVTFSSNTSFRTETAAADVDLVLQASHRQRLTRVMSARRSERHEAAAQLAKIESIGRSLASSPATGLSPTPLSRGRLPLSFPGYPMSPGSFSLNSMTLDEQAEEQMPLSLLNTLDEQAEEQMDFNASRRSGAPPIVGSNKKKSLSYSMQHKFRLAGKPEFSTAGRQRHKFRLASKPEFATAGRQREGSVGHLIPKTGDRKQVL